MNLNERILAFDKLGKALNTIDESELNTLLLNVKNQNPWFTEPQVRLALAGISRFLSVNVLQQWTANYSFTGSPQTIGVAMAGNIPMVGFHDFLNVLIAGHRLRAKLSSQDNLLLPWIAQQLIAIEPGFSELISFEERLNGAHAMIATGSDNTARYFEYYFRNVPHIIRKNRSSAAVILGEEDNLELKVLGKDVFSYFGLGCRNVSKIFVPAGYDFKILLDQWNDHQDIIHHHKYCNNYDYQKSILLVNRLPFFDTGFLLLTESTQLVSPIAVVNYETYHNQEDLHHKLESQKEKIQCIVSAKGWFKGSVAFGMAQFPEVWDYADGVDILRFLEKINP